MKQREYFFDNAKFILIFLVVFGHFLRSFIHDNEFIYSLYKVIYTFHMPAFILISGFFAKGFRKKGYIINTAKKLILPYLLFQIIYSIFYYLLYDQSQLTIDPLDPHWSLWFLISLFFWNIMLYGFVRFKKEYALILSVVLALAVGFVDFVSGYLSLSRTFVFFPLFLMGFYFKKEYFYRLLTVKIKITSLIIFIAVFLLFYHFPNLEYEWLLGSKSYAEMEVHPMFAMFIRTGLYLLCFIMMASFFALVPKEQYFFTTLGRNSLYVYLLHGFIIRLFRASDIAGYFQNGEGILMLAAISLILTFVLSSKTVTSFAQPFIELKVTNTKRLFQRLKGYIKFYWNKWVSN
jgi:fucose 4-O-acetylase-like acetyltransferase